MQRSVPAPRYPASLKVAFAGVPGSVSGEATNISSTGMFVRTDTELPVGAVVSVALELPDGEGPVPVHAKVIHVRTPFLSGSLRLDPAPRAGTRRKLLPHRGPAGGGRRG